MYDRQFELEVVKAGSLASAADIGNFTPGYMPVYVRAVAVVLTTTASCAGVVKVDKRPTVGSDTSRGDGDIASITIPNAAAAGTVYYQDQINIKLSPGEQAVVEVTDATGNGTQTADVIFVLDPAPEVPGNNTDLIATA